jgi:hypothetical protein
MYTDHFGLEENPFLPASSAPPPFSSKELKEALAHFLYALKNREGFFLLVGEVGTGKSTAIGTMLSALPRDTESSGTAHQSRCPELSRRFCAGSAWGGGSESSPRSSRGSSDSYLFER